MEAEKENKKAAIIEPQDYRNAYEDPDPITLDIIVSFQEAHHKVITAFGDEMYDVFSFGSAPAKSSGQFSLLLFALTP